MIAVSYALVFLPLGKMKCRVNFFFRFLFIAGGFLLGVFLHGLLCLLMNRAFDFHRFVSSFVYLICFLLGAFSFALLVRRLKSDEVAGAIRFVFYLLLLTGIIGIFGYSPWFATEKPVFFFSEPSHFALIFLPFLLYVMVISRRSIRLLLLMATCLLGALLQNLTLFVGALVVAFLVFGVRRLVMFAAVAAVLLALSNPTGMRYYLARLDLSPDSTNLSVLVYLNGWERAYLNLRESAGLGIGFNQLGFAGTSGEVAERLTKYAGRELNKLDGGFVAAKLISELGLAGIALLGIYLFCFVLGALRLRRLTARPYGERDCREIFFLACFLMFVVDLFVRGTGYFSSASFLLAASVIWMTFERYRRAEGEHLLPAYG